MNNLHVRARSRLAVVLPMLLALVSACDPYPPPARVSFPDDPRILHGEWEMLVQQEPPRVSRLLLLPEEQLLVSWSGWTAYAYEPDVAGAWSERDPSGFYGLSRANFDPVRKEFGEAQLHSGTVTVLTTPLNGEPATSLEIDAPAGFRQDASAVANGHAFVFGRIGSTRHLYWWDIDTGEVAGSYDFGGGEYGMTVGTGGRTLSIWDYRADKVHVLDTTEPERLTSVDLVRGCWTMGWGQVSADGRWLAVGDCGGVARIYDLDDPATSWRVEGSSWEWPGSRFADDSPEILWVDGAGHVHLYDVTTRVARRIHDLAGQEISHFVDEYGLTYNSTAGLLALVVGNGQLLLHDVAADRQLAALPELVDETARLSLTAAALLPGEPYTQYAISGIATVPGGLGWPEELNVEGVVNGERLHDYRAAAVSPQVAPPPRMFGHAELTSPDDPRIFELMFGTGDVAAVEFEGSISVGESGDSQWYSVALRRR